MRGLVKVSLAVGLVVLAARPAMAQRFGGGGLGGLLTNKSVQEELKLDKTQVDKVTEALTKFREDNKDEFAKLRNRDLPRSDREAVMKKVNEGSQKIASDVLKPEQMKRLQQIQLQSRARFEGPGVLSSPETEKALKLTDKQKDQIKELADDYGKQARDIFQNAGGNFQEAGKKIADLRKDKMDAAMKVLTDEQKKAYKDLTGEPFEVKFERPGGRPQ